MGFKDEIKIEASRKAGLDVIQSDFTYWLGERDCEKDNGEPVFIRWFSKDGEFEYLYNGKYTEFRWQKGKGYYDKCKTPNIAKEFFAYITAKNNGLIEEKLEEVI